ncbi:MAG: c-type cytochrome [Chloroflexi bacterium]|nr:c-type cytochrome [Chloroflexota bacterium]
MPSPGSVLLERGPQVARDNGWGNCFNCHPFGAVEKDSAVRGPDLSHYGTVAATRDPALSAEQYIRKAVQRHAPISGARSTTQRSPADVIPPEDFDALVAFLMSLK